MTRLTTRGIGGPRWRGVCSACSQDTRMLQAFRVAGIPWMVALTGYLAAVNFIIALFNLVPGFPLDGGRLLRAMLWSWSGHFGWATRWATRAGSTFALVLVALGVLRAVGGELVGGLWFVLIGLFLHQAARSSFA